VGRDDDESSHCAEALAGDARCYGVFTGVYSRFWCVYQRGGTFEPNFEQSFWGTENYRRLLDIKRDIDPDNLLTVHQGVGYEEEDMRYQCYPDVAV
jgi:capsule polysaccharide modification protein KpsS